MAGSVVVGTIVGAVVGLLAAPKSGREMRTTLRARAKDLGRQVPQQIASLPKTGREAIKSLPSRFRRGKTAEPALVVDDAHEAYDEE
jgi:gas vesicle protein